jgi:hypothetical protein
MLMLRFAPRHLPEHRCPRPERRLNTRLVALCFLLGILLSGVPAAAAAFEHPMGDAWWAPTPQADNALPVSPAPTHIFGVGDSVMLGASSELEQAIPGIEIDAVVGRQASAGIDVLRARAAHGQIPDVLIFGLGTNGPLTRGLIDDAMGVLPGVQRVVLVNNSMPRSWETPNNALLADAVQRYPNAVLADWHALTVAMPGLLTDDDIHLRARGAEAYAALVAPYALAGLPA